MNHAGALDREEYIEQAYFFRVLRERMATNMAAQEILELIDQEILATTRLPLAIQFLATEIKHSGLLSSGFERITHYFTPFQAFIIRKTEEEGVRLNIDTALTVLEREALYRSGEVTPSGLFVYQFEVLSRNKLGYDEGIGAIVKDSYFDEVWKDFIQLVRRQVGMVDFSDFIYLRSEWYVAEQLRRNADYKPPVPPLFGEKEGRIAKANRGRDPLYLFAALQRQLGYPEVPRPKPRDDLAAKLETLQARYRELETRVKLLEGEIRGQLDLNQFGKPELLKGDDDV
ncbi:MAG TPA: hypothetical protein VGZ25_00125 [Gemmataceae bacterium]|jgi:hypothetical protein|nr:hypothetical protein [Gemmataceae bacterium]